MTTTSADGQLTTQPNRRALQYAAVIHDAEVASLIGKMHSGRVAPPIGDTRETDGHDAAVACVAARIPPKAHAPRVLPQVLVDGAPVVPSALPDSEQQPFVAALRGAKQTAQPRKGHRKRASRRTVAFAGVALVLALVWAAASAVVARIVTTDPAAASATTTLAPAVAEGPQRTVRTEGTEPRLPLAMPTPSDVPTPTSDAAISPVVSSKTISASPRSSAARPSGSQPSSVTTRPARNPPPARSASALPNDDQRSYLE